MENRRISLFDNAKFFLIVLVVAGHLIDFVPECLEYKSLKAAILFIYSFHMPLFIFISGLFHKDKNIAGKAFSYFSTGLLIHLIIHITHICLKEESSVNIFNVGGLPWFMYALAAFTVITYALREVDKRLVLAVSLVAALLVGYTKTNDFLAISRILVFYPFYLAGTITDKKALEKVTQNKFSKIAGVLILAAAVFVLFRFTDKAMLIRPMFSGRNPYSTLKYPDYGVLFRLLNYVISAVMSFAFLSIVPNINIPVLTKFGGRTLQVYVWHVSVVFVLIKPGMPAMIHQGIIMRALYLATSIIITAVLSLKVFQYPQCFIFKYSKKIDK